MQPPPRPSRDAAAPTAASVRPLCEQAASRLAAGDVDAAEAILAPALAARPDDPNLLLLAGHCALARDLDDRARECFERCVALAPGFAAPLLNLGFLHRRHQRIDAARDALRRCLAVTPDDPHAWMNLTATYVNEGEPAAGEAVAREALARCPSSHAIRWNLALLLLEQGKWAEGWREYRVRFDAGVVPPPLYGADDILPSRLVSLEQIRPGQTIVCRGEQGLGDEILFTGMLDEFLTDVRRRGGTAVIDCNPRLRGVFAANFDAEVLGSGTDGAASARRSWTRPIDWVVPLGDLGGFYRTAAEQFPDRAGYLSVPPRSIAALRHVLERRAGGRPLVGLAWTGGSASTHAVHRRIPLTDWLPLLRQDACFVSLQYRDCEHELQTFSREHGIEIVSLPEITQHADYGETFGLVAAVDLVVTVPTSVLHVAGAIGKECWVVMHHRAAWRECSAGDRIRWYPRTHRRFVRGPGEPNWDRQIGLVAVELTARSANPRSLQSP
jgi:Tfp pilus assembly protein PilF